MGEAARDNEIFYNPSPTVAAFMASEARVKGIRGPYGSGKSVGCCMEIMRQATLMPVDRKGRRRSRWIAIRNTYTELKDTTIKTWLDWFPEEIFGNFHHNNMTHEVRFRLADDTVVSLDLMFRALDRPEDTRKLKSLELTGGWINEAVEIPYDVLAVLESRVSRFPSRKDMPEYRSCVLLDTNPPDTDHWWYRLAEVFVPKLEEHKTQIFTSYREALEDIMEISGGLMTFEWMDEEHAKRQYLDIINKYAFFAQPSGMSKDAENVENLDPSYYFSLAAGKPQEWVNVHVHGQYGFVTDGKPVYPEYNDSIHFNAKLLGPDKSNKRILRGWDGGRTPACIFMQMTASGRLMVFDELIGEDTGVSEFADRVKKHSAVHYPEYSFTDIGDPAMFQKSQIDNRGLAQILSAKGIDLQGGIQMPRVRKESVKKILREMIDGKPGFQIGPKAETVRKGLMGGYQFKRVQTSGERYHEKPDKNRWSHPVEAMEYVCTRLFANPILTTDFDYEAIADELSDDEEIYSPSTRGDDITGY